jgi:hypothetical protein
VRGRSKKLIGKLVKGAEAPTQEHRVVVRRYASGSLKEALQAAETLTRNMPVGSADRVRRHREAMRKKGMRPITLWVPDTRSPEVLAEAARQCRLANEADKTDPAVQFFDDLVDESLRDLDESGL